MYVKIKNAIVYVVARHKYVVIFDDRTFTVIASSPRAAYDFAKQAK